MTSTQGLPHSISFAEAKSLAAENAQIHIGSHSLRKGESLLEHEFLEADHAWMFFQNHRIEVPVQNSLCRGAYAVSKRGHVRFIADYYHDQGEARAYLQVMSKYFLDNDL
jgi:hypothetical protein